MELLFCINTSHHLLHPRNRSLPQLNHSIMCCYCFQIVKGKSFGSPIDTRTADSSRLIILATTTIAAAANGRQFNTPKQQWQHFPFLTLLPVPSFLLLIPIPSNAIPHFNVIIRPLIQLARAR